MTGIAGCRIEPLADEACRAWLAWVLGEGPLPGEVASPAWLLVHGDSGVTWGVRDGSTWRLGSDAFPDLCPRPSAETLQELRVFWPAAEVLLWRHGRTVGGRLLRDVARRGDHGDPLRPDGEERLLLAVRVYEEQGHFARVGDGTGAQQALPLMRPRGVPPDRIRVRHYFSQDEKTGVVRVAASRLVELVRAGSQMP